ncbi:unnamed protein product [Larinioides sclopetarius]|uniref:Uncharacterized protein n=1 Tax=Larinioides sclopetarius TaxID=280406 RepID=A0AAV2BQ21_9ARAC
MQMKDHILVMFVTKDFFVKII